MMRAESKKVNYRPVHRHPSISDRGAYFAFFIHEWHSQGGSAEPNEERVQCRLVKMSRMNTRSRHLVVYHKVFS